MTKAELLESIILDIMRSQHSVRNVLDGIDPDDKHIWGSFTEMTNNLEQANLCIKDLISTIDN